MENLTSVIDDRPELFEEINTSNKKVKAIIAKRFHDFLQNSQFIDAVPGHLGPASTNAARLPIVLNLIKNIASLT